MRAVRGLLLTPDVNGGQLTDIGITAYATWPEAQFAPDILADRLSHGHKPITPDEVRVHILTHPYKAAKTTPARNGVVLAWAPSLAPANRVASQLAAWYLFESRTSEELPIRGNAVFLGMGHDYQAVNAPHDLLDKAEEIAALDKHGGLLRYPDYETRLRPRLTDRVLVDGVLCPIVQIGSAGQMLRYRHPDTHDEHWTRRPGGGWTVLPDTPKERRKA
ncbi:hypothetical protein Ppa06_57330 [Planomonospora parontospora subsp. parontospora]|uniref:Uncharacterized protein n=2 Tax=Planomonospora parontospora TaxID=58119 RepID=A0AA37F796_9ACTN|nr:hypothetical protein GCM10010126_57970 [Planomonospora parontospora]GII11935.1 hypothetical protein Ppa06_57330 [Planomonospora parontospora subsp. parontospora]